MVDEKDRDSSPSQLRASAGRSEMTNGGGGDVRGRAPKSARKEFGVKIRGKRPTRNAEHGTLGRAAARPYQERLLTSGSVCRCIRSGLTEGDRLARNGHRADDGCGVGVVGYSIADGAAAGRGDGAADTPEFKPDGIHCRLGHYSRFVRKTTASVWRGGRTSGPGAQSAWW